VRAISHPIKRHELYDLIESGEGVDLEFKRQFSSPEKIAKEIIALANTHGGYILFGVDDDGTVVGVQSEKSELNEVEHAAQFLCDPPVRIESEHVHAGGGKYIVLIRVPESRNKPHVLVDFDSGGRRAKIQMKTGFVRVGENSIQASREVMKVMQGLREDAPPLKLSIDFNERALFSHLEARGRVTLQQFADLVNISDRRASRILVALVRSGTLLLHTLEKEEYYTLA
jgi:predicted HTH transcriptional regulator